MFVQRQFRMSVNGHRASPSRVTEHVVCKYQKPAPREKGTSIGTRGLQHIAEGSRSPTRGPHRPTPTSTRGRLLLPAARRAWCRGDGVIHRSEILERKTSTAHRSTAHPYIDYSSEMRALGLVPGGRAPGEISCWMGPPKLA